MYCRQCGHELESDALFCTQCGASVKAAPQRQAATAAVAVEEGHDGSPDEPVSLKAAMDETKERSKRRIPLVVLVALILALVAGVAFGAYYVYDTIIEPRLSEQQAQDGNEDEIVPAEEAEAAMAAYEGILDEYRDFMAYLEGGGDINDLELDPETSTYAEYPDVNVIGFMDFANREGAYAQYAYADLNDDGIDELLIRSNEPDQSSVAIIQGFTYYDGEVKELFESTYRNQWHIEDNGYLLLTADSGGDTYGQTICMVDPAEENGRRLVESIMFEYEDDYDRMNDDSPYHVTRETPEGTEEFTVTYTEMQEMTSDFGSEYTSNGEEIVLDWQDL